MGMWKYRNGLLHGPTDEETKTMKRKALQQRIDELYKERKRLMLPVDKKIFGRPARFRKAQGDQQMKLWIGLAEDTLSLHKTRMEENPLLQWLNISTIEKGRQHDKN